MSGDIRETGGQERTQRSSRGSRWNSIPNSTNSDLRRGREDLLQHLCRERDEARRRLFNDGSGRQGNFPGKVPKADAPNTYRWFSDRETKETTSGVMLISEAPWYHLYFHNPHHPVLIDHHLQPRDRKKLSLAALRGESATYHDSCAAYTWMSLSGEGLYNFLNNLIKQEER